MFVIVLWIIWVVLGIVLLGLIFYHRNIVRAEDSADQPEPQRQPPPEMLAKQNRIRHVIRIFGGVEGLVTIAIAAFYILDAIRQSG